MSDGTMDDAKGRDLLGFESLKVGLADVRPLEFAGGGRSVAQID